MPDPGAIHRAFATSRTSSDRNEFESLPDGGPIALYWPIGGQKASNGGRSDLAAHLLSNERGVAIMDATSDARVRTPQARAAFEPAHRRRTKDYRDGATNTESQQQQHAKERRTDAGRNAQQHDKRG